MWPSRWASSGSAGTQSLHDWRAPVISGHANRRAHVTNRIAIFFGLFLIAAIVVDVMIYGNQHLIFLGKKMFELIEWIAFWR